MNNLNRIGPLGHSSSYLRHVILNPYCSSGGKLPFSSILPFFLYACSMAVGANSGLYDMLQEYMVENEHLR